MLAGSTDAMDIMLFDDMESNDARGGVWLSTIPCAFCCISIELISIMEFFIAVTLSFNFLSCSAAVGSFSFRAPFIVGPLGTLVGTEDAMNRVSDDRSSCCACCCGSLLGRIF